MATNTKWWEISMDELEHRMALQKKVRTDPVSEMVKTFFKALDEVLRKLGVDPDSEIYTIDDQCEANGVILQSNDDPRTPQLHGIFVFWKKFSLITPTLTDIIPYAWVEAPKMQKDGSAKCRIEWYAENKETESEKVQIIK